MKIYILNDTSLGQVGSQQCMKYIYNQLKDHEIVGIHKCGEDKLYDNFTEAQLVICNGEGTMHDNVPKANFLMDTLGLAQCKNKKTMLVNTVWQNMKMDVNYNILKDLDYVCVREPMSAKSIVVECDIIPDFCMSAYDEPYKPEIYDTTLKNRIAKGETHPDTISHGLLDHIQGDNITLSKDCFRGVIERLKDYDTYITGQHHGIYAAILAEIDFIPISSNTHKIESLIEWIDNDNPKQFLLDRWKGFSLNEKIFA